jgi:hypothetical protein
MQRYAWNTIPPISEKDIEEAFESKFGEKVECRIIVLSKEQAKDSVDIWERINRDPAEFEVYAKKQFIPKLAAEGGKVPPVYKHFGDSKQGAQVEVEAFRLKEGQISPMIHMDDGTTVILKCDKRIPADTTRQLNDERATLNQEIFASRLSQEIPKTFEKLRKEANPQIILRREQPSPLPSPAVTASAQPAQQPAVQAAQQPLVMPSPPPGTKPGVAPTGN